MKLSQAELVKVGIRHSTAEGAGDMAETLATLEADPVYELFPVGLKMSGMALAKGYYENFFANVAPRIVHFEMVSEWINDDGVVQEYDVDYRTDGGAIKTYRILGILTFGETKLSGERLYADEELLRIMFGPVWDRLERI